MLSENGAKPLSVVLIEGKPALSITDAASYLGVTRQRVAQMFDEPRYQDTLTRYQASGKKHYIPIEQLDTVKEMMRAKSKAKYVDGVVTVLQEDVRPTIINGVPMLTIRQSWQYVGLSESGFERLLKQSRYAWVKRHQVGQGLTRYIALADLDKIKEMRSQVRVVEEKNGRKPQ